MYRIQTGLLENCYTSNLYCGKAPTTISRATSIDHCIRDSAPAQPHQKLRADVLVLLEDAIQPTSLRKEPNSDSSDLGGQVQQLAAI